MTDESDKSSRGKESVSRTTARDVPFVRGAGSESEPAPRGHRPAELPRDPTYEAELAKVELAVLRDRDRRDDPSTKQGGRRAYDGALGQPPESVTPESPGTRSSRDVSSSRSPEPPSSGGRSVASGTLLSVGAVDPRGKTERTLETPRMFFSRPEQGGEAYFKPGKIPAVTVHQTIETETVKLADSIDPRRAKTMPRIDRAALARFAEHDSAPDSEAPLARSEPASEFDVEASDASPRWNQQEYEPTSWPSAQAGQIHASLSPFRNQGEPSFTLEGVPTRVEPLAGRRSSEPPESLNAPPDTSTVPTHRDLPAHRIEASQPPPPPVAPSSPKAARSSSPVSAPRSGPAQHSESEGPYPTTASIAVEAPVKRAVWQNLAAFAVALCVALALGWWLTGASEARRVPADSAASAAVPVPVRPMPQNESTSAPRAPEMATAPSEAADVTSSPASTTGSAAPPPRLSNAPAAPPTAARPAQKSSMSSFTSAPAPVAPRKSTPPKTPHETIF